MAKTLTPSELGKNDIQVEKDFIILKGKRFSRPNITAIAVNNDTVPDDGIAGSIRLAQVVEGKYNVLSTQPAIEEQLFIVNDDAGDHWNALKTWLRTTSVQIVETTIPNIAFTALFKR